MTKLSAVDVAIRFNSRSQIVRALDGVSLDIEAGEFVSIVGPSGCGKTTFLRLVGGLLKPSSGRVLLDGREIRGAGRDRGIVFQQDGLFPWRTVLDNVGFGLSLDGVPRRERDAIVRRYVDMVGLNGFEQSFPHELSGGMRQRANLARAMAINPEVLLMDEPFAALDAQTRERMQSELLRVWDTQRKTVLFVTHQVDEAVFLSDRVVVLTGRPGRVREIIPTDFERPRTLSLKRSPTFISIMDTIWSLLADDDSGTRHTGAAYGVQKPLNNPATPPGTTSSARLTQDQGLSKRFRRWGKRTK